MLQQTYSQRYYDLLAAGYKPAQILTCPRGDPCWCEIEVGAGRTYVKNCGLSSPSPTPAEPR